MNDDLITYDKIVETKDSKIKQLRWDMATGLQKIDNLEPSKYLKTLIKDNVNNKITVDEVEEAVHEYYKKINLSDKKNRDQNECDVVSARINRLLNDPSFTFHPTSLKVIHKSLFKGIYDFAGKYRTYNIEKQEPILNSATVIYGDWEAVEDTLDYDFKEEQSFNYQELTITEVVEHISKFTSAIWQVHAFGEGNTRTTAVLIEKHLRTQGFNIDNELFKEHSLYFRNALVRSNYYSPDRTIRPTNEYLHKFYDNLINNGKHKLNNNDLFIDGTKNKEKDEDIKI